jgi:hypothetical protein
MLNHPGVPPHHLRLKEGCICTLMRNLSVHKGLVKNARVIVKRLHHRFIEIQVVDNRTGNLREIVCIPRIRFEFNPPNSSWTISRLQFPLRLAYACTFNSSQGLTLDKSVLDLRSNVFAHGQLYTALSRVRGRSHTRILFGENASSIDNTTTNVVYEKLLL